jgi:hypothetical protein
VRVKSKIADSFLMKKIEIANIARDIKIFFKKMYSIPVHNMDRIVLLISKESVISDKKEKNVLTDEIYESLSFMAILQKIVSILSSKMDLW